MFKTIFLNRMTCCRPCLRCLKRRSLSRCLSTTPSNRKHGALPTFHPTSSPELDGLLSTFRSNVFLPSHLITAQRNLLYRPKNYPRLTNPDEPATVKIANEVLPLKPLNRLRDEPPTRQSFARILDLLSQEGDGKGWANLPEFLEGLKTAKRKLKKEQIEKLVRRANLCGKQGILMVCFQRVERTGMVLGVVAGECLLGAVMKANSSGWTKEAVEDAARLGRQYWEMLWDKRHGAMGPHALNNPELVGLMVLLCGLRALKTGEGKEDLEKFLQRLLAMGSWNAAPENTTPAEKAEVENLPPWIAANRRLVTWAPVWKGLQVAQAIVGKDSEMGRDIGGRIKRDLEPWINEALADVAAHTPEGGSRRGVSLYEDLAKADI